MATTYAAAHAATTLLHAVPRSPFFSRPGALDDVKLETFLVRMRWVMTFRLLWEIEADEEWIRAVIEESAIFFSRDKAERDDVLAVAKEILRGVYQMHDIVGKLDALKRTQEDV